MDKKKKNWFLSGGSSLNATYAAYFAALPTAITPTVKAAQNQFCVDLGSLLARMKIGYFLHAGAVGNAKINLVNPALYAMTAPAGDPTFSEGNGCKSNGSTYFSTGYPMNTSGAGVNTTCIGYVSESSTASVVEVVFAVNTGVNVRIGVLPRNFDSSGYAYAYTVLTSNTFVNANHKGLYTLTNDPSNVFIYKDGVKTTYVGAPTAPGGAGEMWVLSLNEAGAPVGPYTKYTACFFIFDRFTDADELAFRTAWNTYKTAVSLP